MSEINTIFSKIDNLTHTDGQYEFINILKNATLDPNHCLSNGSFILLKSFLRKIFDAIDELGIIIKNDDSILISVKNQKYLRTCFQLITSISVSSCLIPGLGLNLAKRCTTSTVFPSFPLTHDQKYEMLVNTTDFFTRSYSIPVRKNIILTLHLSDYLAALIQLSFAPFKKPGTYSNYVMTQDRYDQLSADRKKYVEVYNHLVVNCFQPILMKELLVLQNGDNPAPPAFLKKVIAKELSQRLLAPGGLISLIRCFIESYNIDTGFEWKKIEMICRIVAVRHGSGTESEYLTNICSQLKQILCLNNTHYLATAVACVLSINDKFPHSGSVIALVNEIFQAFDYDYLTKYSNMPGTVILSPQEVDHKVNILHACVCTTNLVWPIELLVPNLFLVNLVGIKCTKNQELKIKVKDVLLKSLEKLRLEQLSDIIKTFLFGKTISNSSEEILAEEYDAGISIKCVSLKEDYPSDEALVFLLNIFKSATDDTLVKNVFQVALKLLIDLGAKRQKKGNKDILMMEDEPLLIDEIDQKYAVILQLLSEISTSPKIVNALKRNPLIVCDFIEHFLLKHNSEGDECSTIALVLLNNILTNSDKLKDFEKRFSSLIPMLKKASKEDSSLNGLLSKEALNVLMHGRTQTKDTECEKAISDVFDELLPVRAHGVMKLTKLIDRKDAETISKKHYIFCIFQEQLKDPDTYIYLAAINGLASLCTHCTEDVLFVLCKEFLQVNSEQNDIQTKDAQCKTAELRMKIGDVIVKVTRRLGEMAIVHKTILLNTMLCACRDDDPLIRTSAISNLAEIALVLHYKIGSIIYEMLLCIWNIIESDKAIECRRAAVMVISSLIKGLGKDTLVQLKENLLPIYRTLKCLYRDNNEDDTVRLHAQIALEELNDIVNQFMFPELKTEKQIFVLDKPHDVFK